VQCERCGENPATVHVTKVVDGKKTELHLCAECAREEGPFAMGLEPHLNLNALLAGLLGRGGAGASPRLSCPRCGESYAEFANTGLLGCAKCYAAFARPLQSVLRRVHGADRHRGKTPSGSERLRKERRVLSLNEELRRAIADERYEDAAVLRDKIREAEGGDGDE